MHLCSAELTASEPVEFVYKRKVLEEIGQLGHRPTFSILYVHIRGHS